MSDQTPDTSNGVSDGQDPSMEDILASIRKIIAEDDNQAANAPVALDITPENDVVDLAGGDVSELLPEAAPVRAGSETLDLDILAEEESSGDTDIDALIGDMDDTVLDIPPVASFAAAPMETLKETSEPDIDDILSLDMPLDEEAEITLTDSVPEVASSNAAETLALDENLDLTTDTEVFELDAELADMLAEPEVSDTEIVAGVDETPKKRGLMGGAIAALGLGGAAAASAKSADTELGEPVLPEATELESGDDLALMLDNMLEDSAAYQEEADTAQAEQVVDPAEELLAELDVIDDEIGDDEVALDINDADATAADPDIDLVKSLMADLTEEPLHEDEASEEETAESEEPSSDDVMEDILAMTIDDETKLSEDISIPEIPESKPTAAMSLKDIAAAAEADAEQSEGGLGAGLAAAAGLGVVGTALAAKEADEDAEDDSVATQESHEIEDLNPEETTSQELNPEETPDMASAKKSDAIIDEVTETAATGAFASLTSVVEEKAVKAERGDRIGDLVMEALQPMLKEWLDANLKGIVERAVTKEVKRISSGK